MKRIRRRWMGPAAAQLMVTSAARLLIVAAFVLAAPLSAQPRNPDSGISEQTAHRHAEAVELARTGRHEQALAILSELRAADPDNISLLHDEILVLGWAERDAAVLDRAVALEHHEPPVLVLTTVAKAARNLGHYTLAATWYERVLERDAAHLDARLGLAMTYADEGAHDAAERVFAALPEPRARSRAALLARAYLHERADEHVRALNAYETILERTPDDRAALRGKALALRSLLVPSRALALAEAHPGILSDAEIERLRADELAVRVRLVTRTPYRPEALQTRIGRTVEALEARLARDPPPAAEAALRNDRIVALAEGSRSAEAIEAFERRGSSDAPPYVLAAVGRAYLRERHPEKALPVLRRAVEAGPDDLEPELDLFYTYLDLQRHERALELARGLIDRLPPTRAERGSSVVKGNEDWVRAQIAAALAEASAGDLADAEQRLEPLLAELPGNPDLRHELANVYRWRGWLDRSLFEYAQVLTNEPELVAARVGNAHVQLDARRFGELEPTLATLNETHASDAAVRRLNERWRVHNSSELRLEASTGDSTGATFGTEQRAWDATWLTRPVHERWRGLVHVHDAYASFPEGDSRRRRAGLGVEYRDPRWLATAEVSASRDGGRAGLSTTLERRIGDRWSFSGELELDSNDTQLRAHGAGIESDLAGLTAQFAPHESAQVDFGWQYRELSDGNDAHTAFATGRRRLVNRPRWTLALTGEARASTNARQDVPYFSPERDSSLLVGGRHEWRIFRRYERSVSQIVELQAGAYRQTGERDGRLWRLGYEARIELGRRLGLNLRAERYRMFYDGAPEYGTSFTLGMNARF